MNDSRGCVSQRTGAGERIYLDVIILIKICVSKRIIIWSQHQVAARSTKERETHTRKETGSR